jgi:hypothetical protein
MTSLGGLPDSFAPRCDTAVRLLSDSPGQGGSQLRNIARLGVLLAALTIVAVVSPEDHRSTVNNAILVVALAAVAGSCLALALGSKWFAVVRQDVRAWRRRHRPPWGTRLYAPLEVAPTIQRMREIRGHDETAITAPGMPCLAVALEPRTVGDFEDQRLKHAVVTCVVARRSHVIRSYRAHRRVAPD